MAASLTLTCFQKKFSGCIPDSSSGLATGGPRATHRLHTPAPGPSPCQPGTSVLKAWGLESAQVVDNYPACCCLHVDEALLKPTLSAGSLVIVLDPGTCGCRAPTPSDFGAGCQGTKTIVSEAVLCDALASLGPLLWPTLLPVASNLMFVPFKEGRKEGRREFSACPDALRLSSVNEKCFL